MPRYEDLEWQGLTGLNREAFAKLSAVDASLWRDELKDHAELFDKLKSRLPKEMAQQREELERAL